MNNDYNNPNRDQQNQNGQYNNSYSYQYNQGNFSPYGQFDPFANTPFQDPYGANRALGLSKAANAKNLGIAALIFSILSFCLSPVIGLILGIFAIVNASNAEKMIGYQVPDTKNARTLGIASIIIVAVVFVLSFILGVVLALLMPELFSVY